MGNGGQQGRLILQVVHGAKTGRINDPQRGDTHNAAAAFAVVPGMIQILLHVLPETGLPEAGLPQGGEAGVSGRSAVVQFRHIQKPGYALPVSQSR